MTTNNEKPELIPIDSGFSVLYQGKYLYSKRSPQKNILQLISSIVIQSETLVLCVSPVLGYGLKELLEKLPHNSFLLGLEADEELMSLSTSQIDKTILEDTRFLYLRTESINLLLSRLENFIKGKKIRRVIRIDFSGGAALNQTFYSQAFDFISQYISQTWINRLTLIQFGRNYARNFFKNYYSIVKTNSHFGSLIEKSVRKPIIVVGSGPSLDSSIEFIKENRDSFFVLAVDASLSGLYPEIRPDAVVLLESQYWIQKAFIGIADLGIPIIADLTANPTLLAKLNGDKVFFFTDYAAQDSLADYFFSSLQEKNILPLRLEAMGSVGLAALAIAERLASDGLPIFHTGLDFSWGCGFSHSKLSYQVKNLFSDLSKIKGLYSGESLFPEKLICEKGKDEASVFTSPNLKNYAELYKKFFAFKENFFDVGQSGLEINSKKINLNEAKKIIDDFYSSYEKSFFVNKNDDKINFIAFDYKNKEKEIKYFLTYEKEKLLKLKNIFTGKLNSSDEEIKELLLSMPYLYLHFPDYNSLSETILDKHFLSRVRIEIEYFLKTHLINENFIG
ncbi:MULTISPECIES: motility associated factor glycosyltransferase family protein [unclassified Treponema]|uniref:motility associated factor glycosyltransferase family protein n=1 Tax=unclassified Treponema TaxID=2638727 RepID=UPI0020A41D8A|nr:MULTISPECIES: 6-hydroxymethylpterin diphosphokinase MptE-like protein [unclassified Treponema]UTC67382.1 motility associated factor glycosyltransferase family protein [Treponema sp. OMZ 789]UTC70110.1 motility associated factor glycosyltransferase family protein [Treponema sp. OMZ 790]UTC72825.1 motility associated factor glycosyltransferase family protein [Treponema sp. OMZ 791]